MSFITGNLVPHATTPHTEEHWYGEVSRYHPPSSQSDTLYVVKTDWDPNYFFKFTHWPKLYGSEVPAPGAPCLIHSDSRGVPRVIWWLGTQAAESPQDFNLPRPMLEAPDPLLAELREEIGSLSERVSALEEVTKGREALSPKGT